ncbi:MAG TPA: alpha/beta hydrolase [Fulvivirga sp.]|nr:alpha/beta hydrolase [Fulvivirga sp.]
MSKIYSKKQGSGDPIVLIHGFCETSEIWKPIVNKLALSNEVHTLDLPGFGASPLPTEAFTLEDISGTVYQWIVDNNLQGSIIIGHSLGGYVTLALAKNHPKAIKGFGLFHSSALADDEEKKSSRNKTIDFVKKRGVMVFAESFVTQLFYLKNRSRLKKEIEEVTKMAGNTSEETLVRYMEAMRDRPDNTEILKTFDKPVLFIAGDQDSSVPIEKSQAQFEYIKKPFIHVLNNVGHMGMYEDTAACFLAIRQFIDASGSNETQVERKGALPDQDLKRNLGCG